LFKRSDKTTLIQSPNEYINDHFHSPFVIKCQKGTEKEQEGLLLIIILGILIGGILILIRVGDLAVVGGCFFFGLFLFIKNLLAARRRATGASRGMGALTWARKRSMSSSNGGLIRSNPFGEWVIKLRQLMVGIRRKPQVTLDLNNVMAVFIDFLSCSFAHAKYALKCPLDERIMVTTARR
jgi:hypothetical protein